MIVYYRLPAIGDVERFCPAVVTDVHSETCVNLLLLLGENHADVDRHATRDVTSASRGDGVGEWRLNVPGLELLLPGIVAAAQAGTGPAVQVVSELSPEAKARIGHVCSAVVKLTDSYHSGADVLVAAGRLTGDEVAAVRGVESASQQPFAVAAMLDCNLPAYSEFSADVAAVRELASDALGIGVNRGRRWTTEVLRMAFAREDGVETSPLPGRIVASPLLVGSSRHPSEVDVGLEQPVPLREVVAVAYERSGLSAEAWNALPDADREDLIDQEIQAALEVPRPGASS